MDKRKPGRESGTRLGDSKPGVSRRRFLLHAATACGAIGLLARAVPARAANGPSIASADPALATAAGPRSLRFVHTHTGESLTAAYFDGSGYDAASLSDVNHLLRDFRTGESHLIDPRLLDILYDLQVLADRDAEFEVISGYRSPATNAMLHRLSSGVAEHSQHLLGKAIDVRLSGYSTRRLSGHARALSRGGVGFYASSDFVHIDTGRVRYW
jgi:uncharacterized protein YcbK (DUF882 family)